MHHESPRGDMYRFFDVVDIRCSRRRVKNLKWFEMQVGST